MQRQATLSSTFLPATDNSLLRKASLVAGGVTILALLAQFRVQLPFTPVPLTGQSLGVLLVAGSLGMGLGSITALTYVALGAIGLPIFADQSGGIHVLVGATGGYLIGFIAAAVVMGSLAERGWDRQIRSSILMCTIGHAIIFTCGLAWLHAAAPELDVLQAGLLPFLPGAVVKTLIATGLFPLAWRLRGQR